MSHKPTRAAAYYRMSRLTQEDSIDRQRSQVVPFAEKGGYEIVRDYIDEGVGGDEIAKRKEFQRMLRDAQAGAFDVILCDDKDRFGRFDAIDSGEVVAPLRRKGVRLLTVAQGVIDWTSFAGRITDAVLQEAKGMELDAISRRVLSGQLLKAQQGIDTGGPPTYGYLWIPDPVRRKKLAPDGRKAEVVQLVFRLYDQGRTLCAIAEELHRRGVASPRGRPRWTRPVLQRLLINRRYVGDWTWGVQPQGKRHRFTGGALQPGGRKSGRGKHTVRREASEHWLVRPDSHEPLVDRDTFERVQARLAGNRTNTTPHPNGGEFVLSRLMVCSHCGSTMVGITERGKRNYVCRGYLAHGKSYCKKNWVEEKAIVGALVGKLQEAYLDPDNLSRLRAEAAALEKAQRGEGNLQRLRQAALDLDARIAKGNERLLTLPTDLLPGVMETLRQWQREREDVARQLHHAQTASPAKDLEEQIRASEEVLWKLQEVLQAEDAPLLRELLRETIVKVELEWTHREAGKVTRSQFAGGAIHLRTSEDVSLLFPSAARSHY